MVATFLSSSGSWLRKLSLFHQIFPCSQLNIQIPNTPQPGFEPLQNLVSSGFIEWSCAVVIITTPQNHTNLKRLWSQTSLSSLSSLCRCIQIFWLTFHLVRDVINLLYSLCRSLIIFFLCIFSLLNSSKILETNVMVL